MSRKERRKKKNLLSADGWLADMLCADVLAWWMCCVRMRMSRKERKKGKNLLSADGWLADGLRADMLACWHGCVVCGCR